MWKLSRTQGLDCLMALFKSSVKKEIVYNHVHTVQLKIIIITYICIYLYIYIQIISSMSVGVLAQRLITHVCIGPKAHAEDCSSSEEGEMLKGSPR